ncbi:MAG: hypothetical protein QG661_983 [Actinomycetota bacterium]|jgi:hypothetical protein|nr:hypothetical protein [Actinomycetota bacterium]
MGRRAEQRRWRGVYRQGVNPPLLDGTCTVCTMNPKHLHSASEHALALQLQGPLLEYVKTDAFSRGDRPLTYAATITRFDLNTSQRRVGRVLDALECILEDSGWPKQATAGVSAYVVNSSTRRPGASWVEVWDRDPDDARRAARAHMRLLTLGPEED